MPDPEAPAVLGAALRKTNANNPITNAYHMEDSRQVAGARRGQTGDDADGSYAMMFGGMVIASVLAARAKKKKEEE